MYRWETQHGRLVLCCSFADLKILFCSVCGKELGRCWALMLSPGELSWTSPKEFIIFIKGKVREP